MKLFKLPFLFLLMAGCIALIFYLPNLNKTSFNPVSSQNDFYEKLNLAIKTSQIKTSFLKIRDFNNEIEFYLVEDDYQTKIILSTQKDPFWQISVLHKLVKTAKMNQGKLKLVDLSSTHPYATFKNN